MKASVLLGYEVGTGEEVNIPLHHTIVTGTTQLSGKTTTLEGLICRMPDKFKAIMFRTKRGEADFDYATSLPPYYKERSDWQYVQSLLEATMRERMKFERSWIIRATKGTHDLDGVYNNICRDLKTARGLNESVLTTLRAYLDIVLPQIRSNRFNDRRDLHLELGLNVMDLVGISEEVQGLVIASTLEEIHRHRRNTVSVVPEAWKFVPQGRNTPVHVVIEKLAREGAAIGNFVWLDSQDITGVDKGVLKNFDVWILGRQREINEVERALKQVPLPAKSKPKPEQVAQLAIGQFFACYGDSVKKVYVQPAWLPAEVAKDISYLNRFPDAADPYRPKPTEEEDMKPDPRIAELELENKRLLHEIERLQGLGPRKVFDTKGHEMPPAIDWGTGKPITDEKRVRVGNASLDAIEREFNVKLVKDPQSFQTTNPIGRTIWVLLNDLKNAPSPEGVLADTMREHGWNYSHNTMAPTLAKALREGVLISDGGRPALYRLPGKISLIVDGKKVQ